MSEFWLGSCFGAVVSALLVLGWVLISNSGQISREEESRGCGLGSTLPPLDPDLLKLDMGEALNHPLDPFEEETR